MKTIRHSTSCLPSSFFQTVNCRKTAQKPTGDTKMDSAADKQLAQRKTFLQLGQYLPLQESFTVYENPTHDRQTSNTLKTLIMSASVHWMSTYVFTFTDDGHKCNAFTCINSAIETITIHSCSDSIFRVIFEKKLDQKRNWNNF